MEEKRRKINNNKHQRTVKHQLHIIIYLKFTKSVSLKPSVNRSNSIFVKSTFYHFLAAHCFLEVRSWVSQRCHRDMEPASDEPWLRELFGSKTAVPKQPKQQKVQRNKSCEQTLQVIKNMSVCFACCTSESTVLEIHNY